MARHGDPTGWRYYWEWLVVFAIAGWEEVVDRYRFRRRRCEKCGRPAVGRHALSRRFRCPYHV